MLKNAMTKTKMTLTDRIADRSKRAAEIVARLFRQAGRSSQVKLFQPKWAKPHGSRL